MPIRVLYDAGGFLETHGGVSRYFTEMIKHLPESVEWELGMVGTSNVYLQGMPFGIPRHAQTLREFIDNTLHGYSFPGVSYFYKALAKVMPKRFPSGELADEIEIECRYKRGDFDILHLTHPHPVRNTWREVVGRRPIVVTVHDLIPEIIQGNKRVAKYRRELLKDATYVIAVSENTKSDIIRLYGTPQDKISVIHHGYVRNPGGESPVPCDIPWPYLLYVGKRNSYKNFSFFVDAVGPILKEVGIGIFCTGNAFNEQEKRLFDKLGIIEYIRQGFIPDLDMFSLYANAIAFVYPSLYEGFGIPILEAFSAMCPVILSNCSCFPEIAGEAALYFNNGDASALRRHIFKLMDDIDFRNNLVDKGTQRLKNYSWAKAANETAAVYSQVIRGK